MCEGRGVLSCDWLSFCRKSFNLPLRMHSVNWPLRYICMCVCVCVCVIVYVRSVLYVCVSVNIPTYHIPLI